MLLLFGIDTTARLLASPQRACGRCGNHAPHEVVEAARRFTLFFIPICRVGAARYFDTCPVCGLETELTEMQPTRPAATRSPSGRRTPPRGAHRTASDRVI
jgi:hypothetical protein